MFDSGFLLFGALLTAVNAVAASDALACDDLIINIANQTSIDFYKTCPNLGDFQFFISHDFKGPFELPGVQAVPQVSSGYYGPKFKGVERVDDGVTTVSMPDLKNVTRTSVFFGYVNNLTSISFPKLDTIAGELAIVGNPELRNITLPALSTVGKEIYLDGHFDEINLPSLKSVSYIRVESTGNISCPALGAAFASVTFTPQKYDLYTGFTCWTGYENNSWNSSDPDHNPTTGSSSPTSTSTTSSGSSSATNTKASAANAPRVSYVITLLSLAWVLCLSHFQYYL